MSTKKRLLDVVKKIADIKNNEKKAFDQISAHEITQDLPKLEKELTMLYEELERKQNTPITNDLLFSNGFEVLTLSVPLPYKTWRLKDNKYFWFDEYEEERNYLDDGNYGKVNKGAFLIRMASVRTDLRNATDLEDALDLCCIDKDIVL